MTRRTFRTMLSVALSFGSATACVPRGSVSALLAIIPDSSAYHYAPVPGEAGAYRVRLAVRLQNPSPDTVYLVGPCGAGGHPARFFLLPDRDEEAAFNLWGCVGAVARAPGAPDPAYFAVPPRAERADTVWIYARPGVHPLPAGIPWARYAGEFRVAYERIARRGGSGGPWHTLPRDHSTSRPLRLVAPDAGGA